MRGGCRRGLAVLALAALTAVFAARDAGAAADGDVLYVFDLETHLQRKPTNKTWQYDVVNFVTALQGLANRERPRLFVYYTIEGLSANELNVDRFWLQHLRAPGRYFSDTRIEEIAELEDLIAKFRLEASEPFFTGVTVWDPRTPATANVALTVAGADGLLPVRYDDSPESLYTQIVANGPRLPVLENFNGMFSGAGNIPGTETASTTLPKNDAYLWAAIHYLEQGMTAPDYFAFMPDPYDWDPDAPGVQYPDLQNCMIANRDFYVAKKAFFADLDPWWDEVPTDIPYDPFMQGFDLEVLRRVLHSSHRRLRPNSRIIKTGGFVPWWLKYSNFGEIEGLHSPDETAEEFVSILSGYNAVIDADNYRFASMANASVYMHIPLADRYVQNPAPPPRPLEAKNYLLFVIGDFRSSALMCQAMPYLWNDGARGGFPVAWAFNPIVHERIPHIVDWMYETKTPNDYFVSGSAGPALCYPNRFAEPRNSPLDGDLDAWIQYAAELHRRFDLRVSVSADLDRDFEEDQYKGVSFGPELQGAFLPFAPHGVGTVKPFASPLGDGFIPFQRETGAFFDLLPDIGEVTAAIAERAVKDAPAFHLHRFPHMSPTSLALIVKQLRRDHPEFDWELLDPYTFFYLLRQHRMGGDPEANWCIPYFVSHTIPVSMAPGEPRAAQVTLRNDGWEVWNPPAASPESRYRLGCRWRPFGGDEESEGHHAAYVPETVRPGGTVILNALFEAPEATGIYDLILYFERENDRRSKIEHTVRVVVGGG